VTGEAAAAPKALRFDVVAGLVAAAVVIPKAMAYATVAGLPVQVGLYTTAVIQHSSLGTALGRERLLFNLEVAVARYQSREAGVTV